MAERQKGRGGATRQASGGKEAATTSFSLWMIGVGLAALAVIIVVIFVLAQPKTSNRTSNAVGSTTGGGPTATAGTKPTPVIISGHVPELVSPADNASVDSLTSQVRFTWQRVIDAPVVYNIEFQYSDDGSDWGRSEFVYGLNDIVYVRTNPFLNYQYVRWQVWATTTSGDSDKSGWRQLNLPGQ